MVWRVYSFVFFSFFYSLLRSHVYAFRYNLFGFYVSTPFSTFSENECHCLLTAVITVLIYFHFFGFESFKWSYLCHWYCISFSWHGLTATPCITFELISKLRGEMKEKKSRFANIYIYVAVVAAAVTVTVSSQGFDCQQFSGMQLFHIRLDSTVFVLSKYFPY